MTLAEVRSFFGWVADREWWRLIVLLTLPLRRRAVELLGLNPGDVVLDVGCGTGVCFGMIQRFIGPSGQIIGIDISPEMLVKAEGRVARHGWTNVTLIESSVEQGGLDGIQADAGLFSFVPRVQSSRSAMERACRSLRPGARIVALGPAQPSSRTIPGGVENFICRRFFRLAAEDLERPWQSLEPFVPTLRVKRAWFDGAYYAWGTLQTDARPPRHDQPFLRAERGWPTPGSVTTDHEVVSSECEE